MQKKEMNKNNVKTGYNDSLKSKHQMSAVSESVTLAEQPKGTGSTQSRQIEAIRPSDKTQQPYKTIEIPRERIEERAKAIWEQRGRPQGDDQRIWYEAENQLRRELVGQE
jgi:hypothetical protein